jgi:hypothetical protein
LTICIFNHKTIIKSPDPLFGHRPILFRKFSPCYSRCLNFKNVTCFRKHQLHTDILFITQIRLFYDYTNQKTLFPAPSVFQVRLHQFCLLGISILSVHNNPLYVSNIQFLNIFFLSLFNLSVYNQLSVSKLSFLYLRFFCAATRCACPST